MTAQRPAVMPKVPALDRKLLHWWDLFDATRDRDPRRADRIIDRALALFDQDEPQQETTEAQSWRQH